MKKVKSNGALLVITLIIGALLKLALIVSALTFSIMGIVNEDLLQIGIGLLTFICSSFIDVEINMNKNKQ